MALNDTIPSNTTALYKAYHGAAGPKVFPVGAEWVEKEPNEYDDFGQKTTKTARRPINAGRMPKKGVVTGFDASAGFTSDLTPKNAIEDFQDFLFANIRSKGHAKSTSILVDGYVVSGVGEGFVTGDIIYVEGKSVSANLGLKVLAADGTVNKINRTGLTVDAAADVMITRCGHQFGAGDVEIDVTGDFPKLVSATVDFNEFGLIIGEILYIGDDNAVNRFAETENSGWVRLHSISEDGSELVFDKTDQEFVVDDGAAKAIRLYWGQVIKNEKSLDLQVARYCAFRRQMGIADNTTGFVQSQVVTGCVANEFTLNIPEEGLVTYEMNYLGRKNKNFKNDALADPDGTYVSVDESDGINSSLDSRRLRLAVCPTDNSAPIPVIPAFTEFTLTINNNVSVNKAITYVGAYAHTPGLFEVSLSAEGYFVDIGVLDAIDNNADMTALYTVFKENRGIAIDIPLFGMSSDGPAIEVNEPVTGIGAELSVGQTASLNRRLSKLELIPSLSSTET